MLFLNSVSLQICWFVNWISIAANIWKLFLIPFFIIIFFLYLYMACELFFKISGFLSIFLTSICILNLWYLQRKMFLMYSYFPLAFQTYFLRALLNTFIFKSLKKAGVIYIVISLSPYLVWDGRNAVRYGAERQTYQQRFRESTRYVNLRNRHLCDRLCDRHVTLCL